MPYSASGEWSIWDTHDIQDLALDPINDNWREVPPVPSYDYNGNDAPCSVFTSNTDTDPLTQTTAVWYPERKELRLYVRPGVTGGLIGKADLDDHLGRAIAEHGKVDRISLVFRQGDISARSSQSANIRLFLHRNDFKRVDSYAAQGLLYEKDLTAREVEAPQPNPSPKPEPKPLTPTEQAQRYRDAGLNIPPYLQRDLILEQEKQTALENDPYRKRDELQRRIAELEARARKEQGRTSW